MLDEGSEKIEENLEIVKIIKDMNRSVEFMR